MFWVYIVSIFLVSLLACWGLSKLAPSMGLMAVPGEHRAHQQPTPMVGGIGICLAIAMGLLLDSSVRALFPAMLLLCLVGLIDDRYALPSFVRLIVQGFAAYLMVKLTGVSLSDLGYLLSFDNRVLLKQWALPMTIFAVIGVINAVNMSDGVDGLAGCLVCLTLAALILIGHPNFEFILIALFAILGFLFWNLRIGRASARVFMGDAGSTMLGLMLAYLLIQHSQLSTGILPVTALWLMALMLIDAVAVLIVRPLRGRSPFAADRIHYHHQLIDNGVSVNATLLIALSAQCAFIVLGVLLLKYQVADHLQLYLFLVLFVLYLVRLLWFTRQSKAKG
jgi:UDP-GlcNAc:undecaprenyl-phosphate GlcNAc-1-phosphate transferase